MPKKRKPPKPRRYFQTDALARLRKELEGQGIHGTRARIPKDFVTRTNEAMIVFGTCKPRPPGRPKGKNKSTLATLERIAQLQADGLNLRAVAKTISMDYDALRKYLNRNRAEFEQVKQGLQ